MVSALAIAAIVVIALAIDILVVFVLAVLVLCRPVSRGDRRLRATREVSFVVTVSCHALEDQVDMLGCGCLVPACVKAAVFNARGRIYHQNLCSQSAPDSVSLR